MTGIQALESIHPSQRVGPGRVELVEFEYTRHGTQTLIANVHVATGEVISPNIGPTRTQADFLAHIQRILETDPQAIGYSYATNSTSSDSRRDFCPQNTFLMS